MNNTPIPARDVVVIGASTGGVEALRQLVAGLPSGFPAAVLIVMHIGTQNSILPSLLARTSILPVRQARDGDLVEAGRILVAPPDLHLTIVRADGAYRVLLARSAKENFTRPAIDPLFRAAAAAAGGRAIGVILTGALDDGTAGLAAIKACGGCAIVQDPGEALAPDMPLSAIDNVDVDHVLKLAEMPSVLARLIETNSRGGMKKQQEVPEWVRIENQIAVEGGKMEDLARLAKPSTFTCPECNGALWEIQDLRPQRYRCHTGHAFTASTLATLQSEKVEEAVWSAVRALHEREMLLRDMAGKALNTDHAELAAEYTAQAGKAQQAAEVLRRLLLQKTAPV